MLMAVRQRILYQLSPLGDNRIALAQPLGRPCAANRWGGLMRSYGCDVISALGGRNECYLEW